MSARDRMDSASIPPGAEVKVDYFNMTYPNSIEYNIDQEQLRRAEHAFANFVVTIPTLFDDEFGGGYTASDSLEVTRNTSDNATVDIQAGIAYIGGRRYKQLNEITGLTVEGNPNTDATYYIQLRYTKSTGTFDFYASTTEQADSASVKYLTLASATWDQTTTQAWTDSFVDLRASNTSLPPPITFTKDDASNYILTVQNTNASLLGLDVDGYIRIGTTSKVRKIDLYGSNTVGLTIHDGSSTSVTLVSDNTDRLKVLSNLYVPTQTQLGSMTFSATTFSGCATFDCGASPSFTTSSGDFDWNSENFGSVGTIGCGAITSTSTIQGTQGTFTITTGTAPLVITSTTLVDNLNVDQVDGYDLNQAVQTSSSPTFAAITLGTTNSITLNSSGTDPVISAKSTGGELYFGDGITVADKETSPDWSITGAGLVSGLRFVSSQGTGTAPLTVSSTTLCANLNADLWDGYEFSDYLDQAVKAASSPTFASVAITSGPTISSTGIAGASGDTITGFTSMTLSGSISAATNETINGIDISAGTISDATWEGNVIAAQYLGAHSHTSSNQGGDYAWADITGGISDSPSASSVTAISAKWANDNFNQAVNTTSSPTFAALTITSGPVLQSSGIDMNGDPIWDAGAWTGSGNITTTGGYLEIGASGSNPTTDGRTRIGVYADGIRIYECSSGSLSGSELGIFTQALPYGWIIETGDNKDIHVGENLYAKADATFNLGNSSYSWNYMYAQYVRYDVDSTSYDHIDDLAVIDALGPSGEMNENSGEPGMDNTALPSSIRGEDGFIDAQNYTNLLAGGIKQLHKKVKNQDELIGVLMDKIEELEERLNERPTAS